MSEQGLAHRDLKLENILLKGPGGGKAPIYIKIADFGTGTDIERTNTSHEIGTKCNNAIWDAMGNEAYDAGKYDVFQLGCVLLQLLCVDGMQRKRVFGPSGDKLWKNPLYGPIGATMTFRAQAEELGEDR